MYSCTSYGDPCVETGHNSQMRRSSRHDLRLPFRYRLEGRQGWRPGETINVSTSGFLFLAEEALEVDSKVEIVYPTENIALLYVAHSAVVVRRVLSNWPETRCVFGAQFSS
jgi:PilZ domain